MILLDTQSVIWLNQEQEKLSRTAVQVISDTRSSGEALAIADITLWEIARAVTKNKVTLSVPLEAALDEVASLYRVLPITPRIAGTAMTFAREFPGDPADRIIAATAIAHKIPLISSDKRIRASGEVPCIW